MTRILHFSDLHLTGEGDDEGQLASMGRALARVRAVEGNLLIILTGDLFTSSDLETKAAIASFVRWHAWVKGALGRAFVPTLIVPGNHDVRRVGVIKPSHARLFAELRDATVAAGEIHIHFTDERHPVQTVLLRRGELGLPADTLLVDSTYLATGAFSAGGAVRPGDLLHAIHPLLPEERRPSEEGLASPPEPLFVILHHHLVPNQITDESLVTLSGMPLWTRALRWGLSHVLANADHEEVTMTAAGAGTALSMLHALERPILVMHGHKHYPFARLLRGVQKNDGDVLLTSAGSARVGEPWRQSKDPADDPWEPIWPSFNVVDFDGTTLEVRTIAYDYRPRREGTPVERRLVSATLKPGKSTWHLLPVDAHPFGEGSGPRIVCNRAVYELEDAGPNRPLWSAVLERIIEAPDGLDGPYMEVIDCATTKAVIERDGHLAVPVRVPLELGVPNRFRLVNGLCGTYHGAQKAYKDKRVAPFEWVDLFNRFRCERAVLVLRGYPTEKDMPGVPFGSVVDLTTGVEKPARLTHVDGEYRLCVDHCPARTLLENLVAPVEQGRKGERSGNVTSCGGRRRSSPSGTRKKRGAFMLAVYHVSDLHFHANSAKNTKALRLLAAILKKFNPETDYLLATGDITNDGDDNQTARAVDALRPFHGRILAAPGNHDYAQAGNFYSERRALNFEARLLRPLGIERGTNFFYKQPVVDVLSNGGIEVAAVGLNSVLETENLFDFARGEIGEGQLAALARELARPEHAQRWRLVYMHHRPQFCGAEHAVMRLMDADRFCAVVKDRVHVVAFGHSGGAQRPTENQWQASDTGITVPAGGMPYMLNGNNSVEELECNVITFDLAPGPGLYPSVVVDLLR